MLQYMLDTNICIYINKSRPLKLLERFNQASGRVCVSTITTGELYFGAEKSERKIENYDALERFFGRIDVLPFSKGAASHYAQIRAMLQKSGKLIGPYDMLIGAHARAEDVILVTNNEREFRRIPDLRVENWV
jgi:tRNA(fMet)-specific endonuclease VapC